MCRTALPPCNAAMTVYTIAPWHTNYPNISACILYLHTLQCLPAGQDDVILHCVGQQVYLLANQLLRTPSCLIVHLQTTITIHNTHLHTHKHKQLHICLFHFARLQMCTSICWQLHGCATMPVTLCISANLHMHVLTCCTGV